MADGQRQAGPPPPEAAIRALIHTFGLVRRAQEPYFARFGITGAQWGVLRALHRAENDGLAGLRLTDLGDRLLIRPPSVTGVIDRMQRQGLVLRANSETDLRTKYVSLTPAGHQLTARILEAHGTRTRELLGPLTPNDQRRLCQLLDRLGAHLETIVEHEGVVPTP
jgi:DNA-binding MarR family transcriptional regulator